MCKFRNFVSSLIKKAGVGLVTALALPVIVLAVTTIGSNISTDGNITPGSNNSSDFGAYGTAWNDVVASGTIYGATIFNSGNVNASGTTYLSHTVAAGNNIWDLGSGTSSWRNVYASGTLQLGTNIISATNNNSDLGAYGNAFNDVVASGTIYGATIFNSGNVNASGTTYLSHTVPSANNAWDLGSGTSSWRNINASTSIALGRQAASTTLNVASNSVSTTKGQGTCIMLRAADGTLVYLSATSSPEAAAPWRSLAVSTVSCQ